MLRSFQRSLVAFPRRVGSGRWKVPTPLWSQVRMNGLGAQVLYESNMIMSGSLCGRSWAFVERLQLQIAAALFRFERWLGRLLKVVF